MDSKFQNLVKSMISRSGLIDDPIKSLKNVQNLLSLSIIHEAYEGESLHFNDGGLQNPKELYIAVYTFILLEFNCYQQRSITFSEKVRVIQ